MRRILIPSLFVLLGVVLGQVPLGDRTVGHRVVEAALGLTRWVGKGAARYASVSPTMGNEDSQDREPISDEDRRRLRALLR